MVDARFIARTLLRQGWERYGAKGRHRFKHEIITPSFVLFADNGIDNPCHSYGYAFGIACFVLDKNNCNFSNTLCLKRCRRGMVCCRRAGSEEPRRHRSRPLANRRGPRRI